MLCVLCSIICLYAAARVGPFRFSLCLRLSDVDVTVRWQQLYGHFGERRSSAAFLFPMFISYLTKSPRFSVFLKTGGRGSCGENALASVPLLGCHVLY